MISSESQVSPAPSMRAEMYDTSLHRLVLQFTAFKVRQLQLLAQAVGKMKGIEGERARMILKRGIPEEAAPVETLRIVENTRKGLEAALREQKKSDVRMVQGADNAAVQAHIDFLKGKERELNAYIAEKEPLSRADGAKRLAKYYAKLAIINMGFTMLWDSVDYIVTGDEEKRDQMLDRAIARTLLGISPNPRVSVPVIPNFQNTQMAMMSANKSGSSSGLGRAMTRDAVNYAFSITPYLGLVDRATGRIISGAVVNTVAPKKER
jgi:hypothetical protein